MANDNKPKKQPAAVKNDAEPLKAGDNAPKNLTEAKLRVMAEVQYVRKRGKMGTKYNFVRDTDVIAALRGPMIANGLALVGPVEIRNRSLGEIATGGGSKMFRADAEFCFQLKFGPTNEVENVWVIGEGADNLDKASNKCMSAARKYALILGFNLTSGEDPDQFDEEGRFGGGEHDHDNDHDEKHEPPAKAQNTTTVQPPKAAPKSETKAEKPKPAGSGLPANGAELAKRLGEYDAKLANQKLGTAGALLAHVTQAGVKAGYAADLAQWSGPAIEFAVEAVKAYEAELRKPKAEEPKAEPPKSDEPKAPGNATQLTQPPSDATAAKPAPAAPTAAPTATGPDAQERFTKRIAGMNGSATKENLDKFRERYSQDKDMNAGQVAELEKCYWLNVKRVTGK